MLRAQIGASKVGILDKFPFFQRCFLNILGDIIPGIVEQNIEPSKRIARRPTYERLTKFAEKGNVDSYSADLIGWFLADVEQKYEAGTIGSKRRNHLRRASLLLRDYVEKETIEWKPYVFKHQPNPASQGFLRLHSRFIDNLRFYGRSENTIQSCKNAVRQFFLFLEDNGCSTLSMATSDMVPSFFQHLLATYRPTSIRTVASNIRSFLRFSEKEEKLLPAVPSRCARSKPIIPILSDKSSG